ncbi:MAG TPA: hypothetical protein VFN02_13450, partial [Ktedonobacteraceae bacterium]|nr:hypothetical protein [Ktedonobacteraceae bacterium]
AVTSAVLVTTIATVAVFFLPSLRNAILGHGQPPAALILHGSVVPGGLISIHGSNFSSGGTITITVDGHPATIASNPAGNQGSSNTQNLASFALGAYQTVSGPASGTTVSVRSDGSFDATLRIDPAWPVGSSHLVVATEQSSGQSARLTIVVPQKPALTSCSRSTTTTTLTLGPVIEGQAQPVAAPFALCTTGSGTINWTASWNQKQAQWLQLTSSGKIQAPLVQQLPISASAAGLKAGTYQTTVTFSSQGSSLKLVLNVTFIVRAASTTACINTSTQALSFIATQGQGNPASQTVTIANCGDPGSWSASTNTDDGANWLSVGSNGGTLQGKATRNVPIRVTSTMLVAGTYTGQVTFKVGSGIATVNVILTVRPPAQKTCIIANPDGLGFTATQGQGDPGAQTISVGNCGSSGDWSASTSTTDGATWLGISQAHGSLDANATGDVSIMVTSAGLQVGTYTGQVMFKLGSSTVIVSVFFTIQQMQQRPCLYANTESLDFSTTYGLGDPYPQSLTLLNCGLDGDWSASAAHNSNWLGVDSTHGYLHTGASKDIVVAVRTAHLDPGEYHDRLIFTLGSSSAVVDVTLVVQPPRDCIQASTQSLDFEATSGQGSSSLEVGSIQIQTVTIGNCGPDGNWLASTAHGSTWFTLDPTHGHLNAQGSPQDTQDVKVAISIADLNPGRYHNRIAFTIGSSTALVDVNLIVQPPMTKPCIKASTGSLTFTAIQGQPDPGPQTVTLTNCGPAGYWSASSTNRSAWLNATPFNGHLDAQGTQQATQDVTLTISIAGLKPDTPYHDQIIFTLGSSTVTVDVTLTVSQPTAKLCVSPSSLDFGTLQASTGPSPSMQVTVTNCGSKHLKWEASRSSGSQDWLILDKFSDNGLDPGGQDTINVHVNTDDFPKGSSTPNIAAISFCIDDTSGTCGSTVATVGVSFTVTAPQTPIPPTQPPPTQQPPILKVSASNIGSTDAKTCPLDSSNNVWTCTLTLTEDPSSQSDLNWSASTDLGGVTFNPPSGTLSPGKSAQETVTIPGSSCTKATFNFAVQGGSPVSVTWTCTQAPTQSPTQAPTQAPSQPPMLTVSPTPIDSTDTKTCIYDSGSSVWTCNITVAEDASSQGGLNWSASTPDIAGVNFSPNGGTLSPGGSTQVGITIPASSCTSGSFNFAVQGGKTVAVPWKCTPQSAPPTQAPTQAPTQPSPPPSPTQPPAAAPIQSPPPPTQPPPPTDTPTPPPTQPPPPTDTPTP